MPVSSFAPTVWPTGFTSQAAADNAINFEALVPNPQALSGHRVFNNTGGVIYLTFDTPATPAGIPVQPSTLWSDDTHVGTLHIYTPTAVPINGGAPSGAGPLGTTGNSITVWGVV